MSTNRWGARTFFVVLAAVLVMAGIVNTPVANALSCDGWYGHACWRGYFKDQLQANNGQDVINGGLDAGDKASFINTVLGHLNSGDPHRITAAQFIILSMSGAGYMPPKSVSQAQIDDWESRVNNPAVTFVREDALFQCNIANSFYQTSFDDIAAGYSTPAEGCGAINTMLDFYANGSLVYRIRVACANPLGNPGVLPGLPPGVPPTVVSCGSIVGVTPGRPEVGDSISVTTTISYTGGTPPPVLGYNNIAVTGVGSVGVASITPSGNTFYLRSNNFTVPSTGRYTVTWTLNINGVWPSPASTCGGTFSSGDSFDVYNYPYIDVRGGDTAAGVRFSTDIGQPCGASDGNAGIVSWNKDGDPTYAGGGDQYGTSAFNFIQDFLSNKGNGNGASYSSLTFANLNVNPPGGQYGGFFGKGPCVDYWSKKPTSGTDVPTFVNLNLNSLADGVYVHNGNLSIAASDISSGKHLAIYVDSGDVAINGNIRYGGSANPAWPDVSQIPSVKIIVHGSIYVGAGVGQLDGSYVAVPTDTNYFRNANSIRNPLPGTISTCSIGFSALSPASSPLNVRACNSQLVVNGSFAANTVYFLRTYGTMSGGQPAEQFNYDPELWLSPDSQGEIDPTYQSIVGLPPVL